MGVAVCWLLPHSPAGRCRRARNEIICWSLLVSAPVLLCSCSALLVSAGLCSCSALLFSAPVVLGWSLLVWTLLCSAGLRSLFC